MVVDDEEDMRALITLQIELENDGLVVAATASSGDEAVRTWQAARPDVIVLDYLMPGGSGLEAAARILDVDPEQHIVLFSAFITDVTRAEAQKVGVRECVLKENLRNLPKIIRKYCPCDHEDQATPA
jgi:CheY-like chemotaxis protein